MGKEGLQDPSTSKSLTQNLAYEGDDWVPSPQTPLCPPPDTPLSNTSFLGEER